MPVLEDYTGGFGRQILSGLKRRGWNVYWLHVPDPDEVIKKGPVDELKLDFSYCLLPAADDPADSEKVKEALEKFNERERRCPYIEILAQKHNLIGFFLRRICVELKPQSVYVSYKDFIDSIDTIPAGA